MKFRVIITGRNTEKWVEDCIQSVLKQENVDAIIDWTDDASDDSTVKKFQSIVTGDMHWKIREERVGAMHNIYDAIQRSQSGEICVLMGGDDRFAHRHALERIAEEYEDPDCWVTYGQLTPNGGFCPLARPIEKDDPRREDMIFVSPFTWRAELGKKVAKEDFQFSSGDWLPSSGDVALTCPIVEMASGKKHTRFISDILYLYNVHRNNDGIKDKRLQDFCSWYVRTKPRYHALETLDSTPVRDDDKVAPVDWGILFMPHGPKVDKTGVGFVNPDIEIKIP